MAKEWVNWSGSLCFVPGRVARPADEVELAHLVRRAAQAGASVRVVGAGHSSSPLVKTRGLLVSLANFTGVAAHDAARREATIGAGMTLHDAGEALLPLGMAFANLGDVDVQTVAGAFATGTHGSGQDFPILSAHLIGGRLVTGAGEIVSFTIEDEPDFVMSARVSLGVLGIVTALRLRLVPAYRLRRRTWCSRIDDCLEAFPALSAVSRTIDFYWYPRSDEAKIRIADLEERAPASLPFARLVGDETGWGNEIIPKTRDLRFDEMEYALPAEAGPACFQQVRARVKSRWRGSVGWRVLYRTIAADNASLSIAYERPTVTISLHQNATLPYRDYFADIEPIFRAYGGRPHWGKKHSLLAPELRPLYPMWDRFLAARQRVDPQGVLLNAYLRQLLGVDSTDAQDREEP